MPRNFVEDEDRQSLRTDNEDKEGEDDEGGQDEQEHEGKEQDEDNFDSSGADSSDQDDAQKARNRGDGGMPGSGSSRRSRWKPSSSSGTVRQRKEWVIISEIPKADRALDAIRREINNMLAHELFKSDYRIPEADLLSGSNYYGGWKHKEVRF